MTKEEYLVNGGLDFTVSKCKMSFVDYDGTHETPFYCTVNSKTGEALGPVKSKYTVLQNADLLDNILNKLEPDTYDLEQSKCGMFQGGKKVYFFIKMKSTMIITGGSDAADVYLYALSSHDGSQRLVYGISTRMHSCSNMFGLLMSDKDNNHVVKHTKKISNNNTSFINEMIDRNIVGMNSMFSTMKEHEFKPSYVSELMDIIVKKTGKDGRKLPEKSIAMREDLHASIKDEIVTKGANYYGLFNGVTHYLTHKHNKYTNWSPEYEMLTGNSNLYIKSCLKSIVNEMKSNAQLN